MRGTLSCALPLRLLPAFGADAEAVFNQAFVLAAVWPVLAAHGWGERMCCSQGAAQRGRRRPRHDGRGR